MRMSDWSARFTERGGWWVAGQGLLTLAVGAAGVAGRGEASPLRRISGVALLGLAVAIGLFGVRAHGRRLTPFPKPSADARLIEHGIYRFIRHPLYTCNLCAFFGWAALWSSLLALVGATAAVVFFAAKARREERWLVAQFAGYPAYRQRVRAFIPWIW